MSIRIALFHGRPCIFYILSTKILTVLANEAILASPHNFKGVFVG